MLKKGAIREANTVKGEFLNNLFLVKKNNGREERGQRLVVNLKHLNVFIPYNHFKMEGFQNLRYLLQEGDYLCKLDLKGGYYFLLLQKNSRKYIRLRWSETQTNFCAYVLAWVLPHETIKNPNFHFAQHEFKNDYLHGRHIFNGSLRTEDEHVSRHSNLLVTKSGFLIKWKKSVLKPVQEIEFSGLKITSVNLETSPIEEKTQNVKTKCQNLLTVPKTLILELTKVIGMFTSTIAAVLPVNFNVGIKIS